MSQIQAAEELDPLLTRHQRIPCFLKIVTWYSVCLSILVTEILLYHHCNDVHCATQHPGTLSIGEWMYWDVIFRCVLNWLVFMLFVFSSCSLNREVNLKLMFVLCRSFDSETSNLWHYYDLVRWIYLVISPLWGFVGLVMRWYVGDNTSDCVFDEPSLYYVQLVFCISRLVIVFP